MNEQEEFSKPWKKEYDKRTQMIKNTKIEWEKHPRMAVLKIRGKKELLDQLRIQPLISGDDFTLIISNILIKNAQFSYHGRVKPYSIPENQTRLRYKGGK